MGTLGDYIAGWRLIQAFASFLFTRYTGRILRLIRIPETSEFV